MYVCIYMCIYSFKFRESNTFSYKALILINNNVEYWMYICQYGFEDDMVDKLYN